MSGPYRTSAERAQPPTPRLHGRTLWSKIRHWFIGIGCSHMGSRSSVLHPGEHAVVIHDCDRCGEIVQIDWYVGGRLEDRWP